MSSKAYQTHCQSVSGSAIPSDDVNLHITSDCHVGSAVTWSENGCLGSVDFNKDRTVWILLEELKNKKK